MTKKSVTFLSYILAILVSGHVLTAPAYASEQKLLLKAKDWDAYSDTDNRGNKVCYMISIPENTTTSQKISSRGDTALIVTHRPNYAIEGQVEVTLGFVGDEDKGATISVDGKAQTRLFIKDKTAWSYDDRDDKKLVDMMKKGSTLLFTSTSRRGTVLKDTYSLSGFTAAYNSITKACS